MTAEAAVEAVPRDDWLREASRFRDHNYQQSWAWGEALGRRNRARCEHVAVRSGAETLAVASVRVKRAAGLGVGVAYVRGGPLTRLGDAGDAQRFERALRALVHEYVGTRGLVLRVLAPLGPDEWNAAAVASFERAGFRPTDRSKAYRSLVLRIDRPLEEVRRDFSRNWKNNLSRGLKQGLELRTGDDDAAFEPLCALHRELLDRKGFDIELGADFYRDVQRRHLDAERFLALHATLDGRVVSSVLVSMLGDTWIGLIGATHASGAKIYAAYYLFWKAIEVARERGMAWFDLGGIDVEGNPGVYNFKKGMGGREASAPGPFEVVPEGVRGRMAVALEGWHRRMREWRRG